MSRRMLVLLAATLPVVAAADAPPPDHFTPCVGKQAGDACYQAGCICVEIQYGCPGDAGTCLSCQEGGTAWCGPTGYSRDGGGCFSCAGGPCGSADFPSPVGCSSAPAAAWLAGLVGLGLLLRRRRRDRSGGSAGDRRA